MLTRPLILALLALATAGAAPPIGDTDVIAKLTRDLLRLKLAVASDDPLKDDAYTPTELQSVETYSQSQAMKQFQRDVAQFRMQRLPELKRPLRRKLVIRPFIGPDQSYKLARVLTGKDLSEANVKPLAEALVGISESAETCREMRTPLAGSPDFRSDAEKTRNALQALGVRNPDLRIVVDSLFRGAIAAATPQPRFTYK